mgnify:CR=1 FL=1
MAVDDVEVVGSARCVIDAAGESNTAPLNVAVITTFASPFLNGAVALYVIAAVGDVLSTVNVAPDVGVDVTTLPAASVPVPTVTVPVPSPVGTVYVLFLILI